MPKNLKFKKKVFKFDKEKKNEKKILDFLKKNQVFLDLSCWIYENFIQKFHKKIQWKNIKYSSIFVAKI